MWVRLRLSNDTLNKGQEQIKSILAKFCVKIF